LAAEIANRRNTHPEHITILSYKRLVRPSLLGGRGLTKEKNDPIVTVGCGEDGVVHIWVGVEDEDAGESRLTHDIETDIACGEEGSEDWNWV
jgi:hypothetical protein